MLTANVIHDQTRSDRADLLCREMITQGFSSVLWPAIWSEDPQTGCHQAHRNIISASIRMNLPMTLIMEDDVMFTAPGAFRYFMDHIPAEFDIYTAGTYGSACKYNSDTGWIRRMSGTHCYIVHHRFYEMYLQMNIKEHLDRTISDTADIIHLCYPMTAMQHPGYSDIAGMDVNYNQTSWIEYPLFKSQSHENSRERSMAQ